MINKKNQCATTRRQAIKILAAGFGAAIFSNVKAFSMSVNEAVSQVNSF